jgi:hypothetical protein
MQTSYTTLLTTGELTTVFTRLDPIWTPLIAGQTVLESIAIAAGKNRDAIVKAASRHSSSDFTDPLKDGDNARDAAFTTLREFVATWAKNPTATPDQRAAGARLVEIIARHGNTLHRLGYTRQSGKMDDLIAELRNPAPAADIALLALKPLFDQMAAAHDSFEDIMADKAATEGGEDLPTIAENRPELVRRINLLLATLAEWQELAPTPALNEAIAKMDEVIVQIAAPALARRTKAQPEPAPTPAP